MFGTNNTEYLKLNSTAKHGFENSYGKFPVAYGNVVILDCNYIFDTIIDSAQYLLTARFDAGKINYPEYEAASLAIEALKKGLDKAQITMCDYTIELDGVLNNQTSYYL